MPARNQGGRRSYGSPSGDTSEFTKSTQGSPEDTGNPGFYRDDVLPRIVAGQYQVAKMMGGECVGIPDEVQAPDNQFKGQINETPPEEGGATWLGKGSSKLPFPIR